MQSCTVAQGICLLTNLNSCNGTYVNEIQLEGDIPVKLEDWGRDRVCWISQYQFLEKIKRFVTVSPGLYIYCTGRVKA